MGLTFNFKSLFSLNGILKIVEIVLAMICISLLRSYSLDFGSQGWNDSDSFRDRHLVGVIAIGSSILISIPLLVGYVFFETGSNLLEGLYCVTAAIMNIAGGALAIEYYHERDSSIDTVKAGLGMGSLMIINALVFLVDGIGGSIKNH